MEIISRMLQFSERLWVFIAWRWRFFGLDKGEPDRDEHICRLKRQLLEKRP